MKRFQIQIKTEQTAEEHIKAKIRQGEFYGDKEIQKRERRAKAKLRRDPHRPIAEGKLQPVKDVVYDPARYSARHTHEKNIELLRVHLKSLDIFFAPPNLTELTSPQAERLPLPCENARILSFSPPIVTLFPPTVNRIAVSEKLSTLLTPVIVSFFCPSSVNIL